MAFSKDMQVLYIYRLELLVYTANICNHHHSHINNALLFFFSLSSSQKKNTRTGFYSSLFFVHKRRCAVLIIKKASAVNCVTRFWIRNNNDKECLFPHHWRSLFSKGTSTLRCHEAPLPARPDAMADWTTGSTAPLPFQLNCEQRPLSYRPSAHLPWAIGGTRSRGSRRNDRLAPWASRLVRNWTGWCRCGPAWYPAAVQLYFWVETTKLQCWLESLFSGCSPWATARASLLKLWKKIL